MLQWHLHSIQSASPHTEASAGECLLSLQSPQGLQNQTEDETQPEEILNLLYALLPHDRVSSDPAQQLSLPAKQSFLSNKCDAIEPCETTALT